MRKQKLAVMADIIHGDIFGKASLIAVFITPWRADRLPTPKTNNMRKNSIAKS